MGLLHQALLHMALQSTPHLGVGGGGWRGCGGKRVDGAGMQFVKDAKTTQHQLEA